MIPPLLRRLALALLLSLALVAGAAADPFEVATYADLCKVGTGTDGWTLDADYIQTADIQCPAGASFTPIGNTRYWFTGSYDGRGYVIRDLFIDMPDGRDVGLFGGVKAEAVITNVTLEDISITAKGRIGGLVGQINSGTGVVIENCTVSGTISGEDTCVGGLIGYAKSVTITNCHTDVEILGETGKIGGLIGYSSGSTITDCSATGNVIGVDWATGGLVGQCYKATVARCYASGNVSGSRYVGGLIGYYEPRSEYSLEDCYATGNVFSSDSLTQDCSAGGLIGRWDQYGLASDGHIKNVYSTGSVSAPNFPAEVVGGLIGDIYHGTGVVALNAYWDTETSGQATSAGGAVGKTTAELQSLATFANWSIATPADHTDETWYIVEGEDYPRLAWEGVPSVAPPVAGFSASPTSGTAPLTVQFTDASTGSPTSRSWTFGDGTTSTAQSPSHTYSTAGTYTVALTVTNAGGSDTETKTGYITVSAAPPTAPTAAAGSPAFPYSQQRKETLSFLLMCWGGLAFVGVFCVVIFLLMNGAQRGSGGI